MQLFTEYSNEFHVIILAQWDGNLNSLAEKIKMPWVLPKLIGAMYTKKTLKHALSREATQRVW